MTWVWCTFWLRYFLIMLLLQAVLKTDSSATVIAGKVSLLKEMLPIALSLVSLLGQYSRNSDCQLCWQWIQLADNKTVFNEYRKPCQNVNRQAGCCRYFHHCRHANCRGLHSAAGFSLHRNSGYSWTWFFHKWDFSGTVLISCALYCDVAVYFTGFPFTISARSTQRESGSVWVFFLCGTGSFPDNGMLPEN